MADNRGTGEPSSEEQLLPMHDLYIRLQLHDPKAGLSVEQAAVARSVYGPNVMKRQPNPPSAAWLLWDAAIFLGLIVCYYVTTEKPSSLDIALLLVLFLYRGRFIWSAVRYMARQQAYRPHHCTVIRAGSHMTISEEDLVPGDVITLSGGNRAPADARIIRSNYCKAIDLSTLQESAKSADSDPRSPPTSTESYLERGSLISDGSCTCVAIRTGAAAYSLPEDTKDDAVKAALVLSKLMWALTIVAALLIVGLGHGLSPAMLSLAVLALYEACVPHSFVGQLCMMTNRTLETMQQNSIKLRENKTLFSLGDVNCICVEANNVLTTFEYEVTSAVVDMELRQFENPAAEFFNGSSLSYLRILLSGALAIEKRFAVGVEAGLLKAFDRAQNISGLLEKYRVVNRTPFEIDEVNYAVASTPDSAVSMLALSGPFPLVLRLCKSVLQSGHATGIREETEEALIELHKTLESQGVMVRSFAYAEVPSHLLQGRWKWEDMPLVFAGTLGLEAKILEGVPEAIAECRLNSMPVLLLTSIPLSQAISVALKSNILTGVSSIQATCTTYADLNRLPSRAMVKDLLLKPELVLAETDFAGKSSVLARLRALGNVPATFGFEGRYEGALAFVHESSSKSAEDVVVENSSLRAILIATHASQNMVDSMRKMVKLSFCSWAPEACAFLGLLAGLPAPLTLPLLIVQKILKETAALWVLIHTPPEPVRAKVKLFSAKSQLFALVLVPLMYLFLPFLAYFTVMAMHGFDPWRLTLLSVGTEPAPTDLYDPSHPNSGNSNAHNSLHEHRDGWPTSGEYDMRLWFYAETSWLPCYVESHCYSSEALKVAQTAFFLSLATQAIFTVLTIRSIISSLIRTRCRPLRVQLSILAYATIVLAVVYCSWLNKMLDTMPLRWDLFVVATAPGAALTIAQLELYKWRLRSRS